MTHSLKSSSSTQLLYTLPMAGAYDRSMSRLARMKKKKAAPARAGAASAKRPEIKKTTTNNKSESSSANSSHSASRALDLPEGKDVPKRDARNGLVFKDFPQFRPRLTPSQMIRSGVSFVSFRFVWLSRLDMVPTTTTILHSISPSTTDYHFTFYLSLAFLL